MIDQDYVTVLRLPGRANKLILRGDSGAISKKPGPPIASASACTVRVPSISAMAELLLEVAGDPKTVIIPSGYFPQTATNDAAQFATSDEFIISSRKDLATKLDVDPKDTERLLGWHQINGQRHIARFKVNMQPTSWMLFDRDEVKGMPDHLAAMSDDEWHAAMCSMVPGLDGIKMVKVPSSTGRVLVDGEPMSISGRHYYVPVVDGQDIERFGATLLQRSFLKGYGFMRPLFSKEDPNEIVGYRQWSIFDPTTFSRERLVYEGAPTVKGEGLELAPPQVAVV